MSNDRETWKFPAIRGRVRGSDLAFHFFDAPDDFSRTRLDLLFEGDRMYFHGAQGFFGAVPITLNGAHIAAFPVSIWDWLACRLLLPLHYGLPFHITVPGQCLGSCMQVLKARAVACMKNRDQYSTRGPEQQCANVVITAKSTDL